MAREAPTGKLDLMVDIDFRLNSTGAVLRHRAADRNLVREERSQHHRHAPLHPSAVGSGVAGLGVQDRLADLQEHRQEILRAGRKAFPGPSQGLVALPMQHDTPAELAQP